MIVACVTTQWISVFALPACFSSSIHTSILYVRVILVFTSHVQELNPAESYIISYDDSAKAGQEVMSPIAAGLLRRIMLRTFAFASLTLDLVLNSIPHTPSQK